MNESRRISLNAIGASAVLHLMIAGLLGLTVEIIPMESRPVSVMQVRLADSIELGLSSVGRPTPKAPKPIRPGPPTIRTKSVTPVIPNPEYGVEPAMSSEQNENESGFPTTDGPPEIRTAAGVDPAPIATGENDEEPSEGGNQSDEMARFLQDVRTRLENSKRYPWLARMQGQEGTARVQFIIVPTGEIREVHLLESSRSKLLDDEAVETVKRVGRFPHFPISWTTNVRVQVPIVFQLESR